MEAATSQILKDMSNGDRRKTGRTSTVLEANWEGSRVGSARVTDISMGGCYLDTIGQARPGETVIVRIRLSDGKELTVSGIASYLQTHTGFGIRFTDLSEEQRELIAGMLAKQEDDG